MKFIRRTSFLTAAAVLSGCAPYMGSCTWVEPKTRTGLEVVEARKPSGNDCNCLRCNAPGRFQVARDTYTLEMWNGDRYWGELYLRARGKDGQALKLVSDSPELRRIARRVPKSEAHHGFEYFMRFPQEEGDDVTQPLRLRVVDAEGKELGIEDLDLLIKSRKDIGIEYI